MTGRKLPLTMTGNFSGVTSTANAPARKAGFASAAYAGDWNAFVFSLSLPLALWVAVRWFVPFYRHSGAVSAYEHLEKRFGAWARTYAVLCYLLTQMARMGTILYLLALALYPMTGW